MLPFAPGDMVTKCSRVLEVTMSQYIFFTKIDDWRSTRTSVGLRNTGPAGYKILLN